jgi:carbamoyltransferase
MSEPRLVLGLHEDTNANAALVRGNAILAAVAEERLTRQRFTPGFPEHALREVLRVAGVGLGALDQVVAANRFHFLPRLPGGRVAMEGEHDLFGVLHKAWLTLQAGWTREGPTARLAERFSRLVLSRRFRRPVELVDHHTAHAWSAWITSGFPQALAVSVDNMGDGFSARVFDCRHGRVEPLWGSDAVQSPGQFYGEIAQFLGFHVLLAGKVTGLAAHGDPRPAYPLMERLFGLSRDGTGFRLAPLWSKSRTRGLFAELRAHSDADIAAAAQRRLEDVLVEYVQRALRETGLKHLALAGGVFANVCVNQRLWALPEVEALFVHPAMSDQGLGVGAAFAEIAKDEALTPAPIPHVFLGPEYPEERLGQALEAGKVKASRLADVDAAVAGAILEGRVVARFTGRMEYGPRALGHRSILYHTRDRSVNDWLNTRLKRAEFMPFAPATLGEHAAECYRDWGPGADLTARFMTVTFDCTEAMQAASPAVVHLDGTARPQLVYEEADPGYYRILRLVHERSGVPSILNTSFNMHGEPIVCTPEDALRCFREGHLDALALGPFWVE